MLFNSPEFILVFLPVTVLVFFLLGERLEHRAAIAWLVLASFFFYGWWNPVYLLLMIFSIGFNYAVGLGITRAHTVGSTTHARTLMVVGITTNLALLGYFKYAGFFVETADRLTGNGWDLAPIILPLAISFFTFQQIAYLVDTYRRTTEEHDFLQYCLFVVFFPQLIAGPIVHHKEMLPQFGRPDTYRPQASNLAVGGSIFFIGLFKKVVIADNLALIATPVFDAAEQGQTLHFFMAARGIFSYTLQLYFDFSGYSDMAIGLARVFGIRLPLNFHSPYRAHNIIEFWRHWHMTLSRFLRDYVYIALGGNRKGAVQRYGNLMATMLLGGLWHGAGWTFVFWGGLHGLYLIANHAWHRVWRRPLNRWWSLMVARLVTLLFVMLAWVFFRAETFGGAINMLDGLTHLPHTLPDRLGPVATVLEAAGCTFDGPWFGMGDLRSILWVPVWLVVLWALPNTQELMARFEPAFSSGPLAHRPAPLQRFWPALYWRPTVPWSWGIGIVASIALLSLSRVSEFLYFQF